MQIKHAIASSILLLTVSAHAQQAMNWNESPYNYQNSPPKNIMPFFHADPGRGPAL